MFFPVFKNGLLSAGRMRFSNNKQKGQNDLFPESKTGPIMLCSILGPVLTYAWTNFGLRKVDLFGPFLVVAKYAETTIFI